MKLHINDYAPLGPPTLLTGQPATPPSPPPATPPAPAPDGAQWSQYHE